MDSEFAYLLELGQYRDSQILSGRRTKYIPDCLLFLGAIINIQV